ncbi:uncharacterized protein LOC127803981 isoform X2 [Diospyros lotus]|uniref:uncharacterized protein LOC127803981 isoform X2 n=1 Tax=Diospyros lotus TaxID=55363 RepID=UPI002253B3EF|nr:uncharacterized protein LOC127803981 isoform X2 [Diospyros lotus]
MLAALPIAMVIVQASKLDLPQASTSLSSPQISSLLFDPHSLSLALLHSDSSISLYPSLSPLSISCLPAPQTLVPPPSSSATFLLLHNPNPNPRVLFVVASPLRGGAAVLLRFWILVSQSFARARLICNQSELKFEESKSGVVFSVNHGISVKLVGSINVLVMYSVSNCKIWVFAARMVGGAEDGVTVKLMKCAVIDCCAPVFSISASLGFLMLGEENGVRVFPLRPLLKGRAKRPPRGNGLNNEEDRRLNLPNGIIQTISETVVSDSVIHLDYGHGDSGRKITGGEGTVEISSNGYLDGKFDKRSDSVKLRSVKLKHDSKEWGTCFVAFKNEKVQNYKSSKLQLQSVKAISIRVLSPNKFMILDSAGDLHLLCLSNPILASEFPCHMEKLTNTMKIQNLAVLSDVSLHLQYKSADEDSDSV